MSKKQSIEQQFRKLDEIQHVRQRPGMYVGSIAMHESTSWVYDPSIKKMIRKDITYNPGLIKIFSEILDNSIDEHKRSPEKLDMIKVDITDDGLISIYDNGGIPVQLHKEENQYVPEMIFSELRAGSNFNDEDDQSLIGTNGVGSCLTNILSTKFIIETCDGKKIFKQEFSNGMRDRTEPVVKPHAKNFTRITFMPDYEYFKTTLNEDNKLKLIKRVVDAAGCNPGIKFYLNGEKLNLKSFEDYVALYASEYEFEEADGWQIGVSTSTDGFDQISFVNSVETYSGGTHVDYIYLQIAQQLRAFFLKKHKVEVKPSDIKQHLRLFICASNINRPKFSSQTKENMISEVKDYKSSFKVSEKFIQKLSKSNVIKAVLDWVAAKQIMLDRQALRELDKDTSKQDPNRVPKFCDATEKKDRTKCMLFITEGDSAAKAIISAKTEKNAKYIGSFPLKGKPLNVNDIETKKLVENKEFKNFMIITGLKLGEEVKSATDLRFGKIIFMSDQDLDGFHIRGLLINMIHRFWPELFTLGIVYAFRTPLVRVFMDKTKKVINFYTENDFHAWQAKNEDAKYKMKYYKGLATSTAVDFKSYLEDMDTHLIPYTIEDETDVDAITLAFSKDKGAADKRKVWLALD
jgi:DNA topoisomerase-2